MLYIAYDSSFAPSVIECFNQSIGPEFPMDARLWKQNIDDSDKMFYPGCWIALDGDEVVGFVTTKSPGNLNAIGVLPAYRRRGVGSELLRRAVEVLRSDEGRRRAQEVAAPNEPPAKLITGQDFAHFFPGVPEQFEGAFAFFAANGWTKTEGWCVDLRRNLGDYRIAPEVQAKIAELTADGIELRGCTAADVPSLFEHVAENFSPRWLAETKQRVAMEGDPSEIKVAVRDGKVIGFAQTFTNRSAKLGPSVYWRGLLGPDYGGLGPIGVGKDVRKIGLGLAILSYGIDEVRKAGMAEMAIDWTVLVDFYGKVGFVPWKKYYPCTLPVVP